MAAYGGYQKTGYGQGGEDGGGFLGASQQGSQGNAGGKSYDDETLRPVTVKQLIDCEEPYPQADLAIDGRAVTQVTVVGQVRAVNPQTTNITYRIDDGTGVIDVKKWIDAEHPEDAEPKYALDQYVRVYGRIKPFNNKKHIGAHFIRPVEDYNEVNYHLLEAAYVHLLLTKGAAGGDGGGGGGAGGGAHAGDDGMLIDNYGANGGAAARLAGRSPAARAIYNFLQDAPGGNEGVNLNIIASGTNLPVRDVMAGADELLTNGMIYTTVDDETWAILDY